MSVENSRSGSIDGQWIRDNENKEYKYDYSHSNDEKTTYQKIVERLALNKIKNELLFNGMLDAQMRSFARDGITITKEQLMQDINKEVARQSVIYDLDYGTLVEETQSQSQIDDLKNNLGRIFDSSVSTFNQNPINVEGTIPREPAVESVYGQDNSKEFNMQQLGESIPEKKEPVFEHTEDEKQEIRSQMQKAQEQLAQTLEWAKQQPNKPQFTSTRGENIEEVPSWTQDRGISGYTEPSLEQVRQGLVSQNKSSELETLSLQQDKETIIHEIVSRMADAGEFSHIPLENVSERIDTMNVVKKRLQEKTMDELQIILDSYSMQEEKNQSSRMHR